MSTLVAPASHVLLPLRDRQVRVVRVTIGLGIGIDRQITPPVSCFLQPFPPMINAVKGLQKVAFSTNHRIQEKLALETMPGKQVYGPLAFRNLARRVTAKADAVMVTPSDHCEEVREMVIHKAGIQRLVEVHGIATGNDFLQLLFGVVASGKEIIVHQDKAVTTFDGYLIHIHVGADATLFARHDTPRAFVWASASEKAISHILWEVRIYGVIRLQTVDLIREARCDVVASTSTDDFVGRIGISIVGREVEYFGHVDTVVMEHRHGPLHIVALLPVIAGDFAERKVGIYRAAPLFLFGIAVDVNESDFHIYSVDAVFDFTLLFVALLFLVCQVIVILCIVCRFIRNLSNSQQ